jgi:hypothetical protein
MIKGRFGQPSADGAAFSFVVEQKRPTSFFQGREDVKVKYTVPGIPRHDTVFSP